MNKLVSALKKSGISHNKKYLFILIVIVSTGSLIIIQPWHSDKIDDNFNNKSAPITKNVNDSRSSASEFNNHSNNVSEKNTLRKDPFANDGVHLSLTDLSSTDATLAFAEAVDMDLEILSSPDLKVTLQLNGEPLIKALTKFADALQIPLINMADKDSKSFTHYITLTRGSIIVGEVSKEISTLVNDISNVNLAEDKGLSRVDLISELSDNPNQGLEQFYIDLMNNDKDADVRAEAANALSTAESSDAFQALVDSLNDSSDWVVDNVRATIAWLGSEKMEPYLRAKVNSADKTVSAEAEDILISSFNLDVSLAVD